MKKILVMEDDPSNLRLVAYTLEQEGYQVLTATNGLAGMRKAQSEEPDLIVLNTMLPGIDGFEICHRLRAEPVTDALSSVRSTAALFSDLGITQERVGVVIIDRDAIFPDAEPSKIKSAIEANTGVSLLEIIPYDTKACLEHMYVSTPILLSDSNCPMAWAIREVAQHIIANEYDGVFVSNDLAAIGCMVALQEKGLEIPDDIALAGFNNDPVTTVVSPKLTTVNYPGKEAGMAAMRRLLELIIEKPNPLNTKNLLLDTELIVRNSSLKNY